MVHSPQDAVDGRRLIFTVTTGRSGTGFLCHILQDIEDVLCLHEPRPDFAEVMRESIADPRIAEAFLVQRKLPFIRSVAARTYIETSHLVCKGFIEPLITIGLYPDLILLHRDKVDVATSLFRIHAVPARTLGGQRFLLSPDDPGVLPIRDWQSLPDWALCYWYCLEIERRMCYYQHLIEGRGSKVHNTSIIDCKSDIGQNALLEFVAPGCSEIVKRRIKETRMHDIINSKTKLKDIVCADVLNKALIIDMIGEVERRLI